VIVQGLGNVGYHAAKFLSRGGRLPRSPIIERDGALFDPDGLDVEAVRDWIARHGGVKGLPLRHLSSRRRRGAGGAPATS
jgi:glutamate dehydrogenase (NAD(P)+)